MGETLIFGMLGKILYAEPDKGWLGDLIREEVFADVPFGGGETEARKGITLLRTWSEKYQNGVSEDEFAALKKDYLYLFIGAGNVLAPVWESVYFNAGRLIFQEQTLQVREWYARFGLEAERKGNEPDDHIGLELSFVGHIAGLALSSLEAGDEAEAQKNLQAQRDFLTQHLLRWAPAWAELVQKHAGTDFYRGLAHLTLGALLAAADLLEIEMPKEKVN
jgi:TorA maturation chaperone TorD